MRYRLRFFGQEKRGLKVVTLGIVAEIAFGDDFAQRLICKERTEHRRDGAQ